MLNIEDIKKLHKEHPFPKEVSDIRERILNSFNDLKFDPVPHTYLVESGIGLGVELRSVSSFVESFSPKEDWDAIAERYAAKNGLTVPSVKRMWKENNIRSTNNGTSTHLFLESYMWFFLNMPYKIDPIILPQYEDGYLIPYGPKQEAGAKYFQDLYDSYYNDAISIKVYPVMPETRMYVFDKNKFGMKTRFAGTMDILLAYCDPYDNKWKLICDDWKTNKSLYNDYNRKNGCYLDYPFNDIINEPIGHYQIQLSSYTLMLRQLDYDVTARNLVWLKDDSKYERHQLKDLSERILEYDKFINNKS